MKIVLVSVIIVLLSAFVHADLSAFPDSVIEDKTLTAEIVVGKQGSSLDVISQSQIGLALGTYIGAPQTGINMLDSETTLEGHKILVGNPCVNALSAAVSGNPSPCDKDYPVGKAYIRFVEANEYTYVIVAGHSDPGTKIAANHLQKNLGKLSGKEIELEVFGDEQVNREALSTTIPSSKPSTAKSAATTEKKEETKEEPKKSEKPEPVAEQESEIPNNDPREPQVVVLKKKNFIEQFFDWVLSFF